MIIEVPQDVIDRLNDQLKSMPEKAPDALRKTINDTAKSARREVARQAQDQYAVKAGAFNKAMKIENATQRYLQATIHTEGRPLPLYGFKARKNMGMTAAKAKVLSQGSLKELILKNGDGNGKDLKAFVTKAGKHVGIFQRMNPDEKRKQQSYFDSLAKGEKGKKTTKRNAIKQLYSVSIPQMAGSEKRVYSQVHPVIMEELHRRLEEHIAEVMEGMR